MKIAEVQSKRLIPVGTGVGGGFFFAFDSAGAAGCRARLGRPADACRRGLGTVLREHIENETHHQQEGYRRDVEFAGQAQAQRQTNPRQDAPARARIARLREFEKEQVRDCRAGEIDDVDDGEARIDQIHPVAKDDRARDRTDQPRARHPAPEQVGDSHDCGAKRRVADPPTPRMIAKNEDAGGDHELGQRRMRIEEGLAVQIMASLRDEMDLIENDLGGMPKVPEARESRRRSTAPR